MRDFQVVCDGLAQLLACGGIEDAHRRCHLRSLRIVTLGFFGWEQFAHAAVSPRLPISLTRIIARTEGYTYAANVWSLPIVQRRLVP